MPIVKLKRELNGSTQKWIIRTLLFLLIGMVSYNWNIMRSDLSVVQTAQAKYVGVDQYRLDCVKSESERMNNYRRTEKNVDRIEGLGKSINASIAIVIDQLSEIKSQVARLEGQGYGK